MRLLRETIEKAPRGQGRNPSDIARYTSDEYLLAESENARKFIRERLEAKEEAKKAQTEEAERVMEAASKLAQNTPRSEIDAILQTLAAMTEFDRGRIIKVIASKTRMKIAAIEERYRDISPKAEAELADDGFEPVRIVASAKRQSRRFREETRPIVPFDTEHEVASLRHLLVEMERANVGDEAEGIKPAHTLFDFGNNRVRIGKDRNGKRRIDDLTRNVMKNAAKDLLCVCKVSDDGRPVEAFLPDIIADQAIIDPDLPLLPLSRFVKLPLFTRDGKLLLETGYDPATGCYIDLADVDLSAIDLTKDVTSADVDAAVAELDFAFGNFRWGSYSDGEDASGAGSRATYYALLLAPLIREIIDGNMPLFAIDKPDAGSGGTLLAESAHIIWTGEKPVLDGLPPGKWSSLKYA